MVALRQAISKEKEMVQMSVAVQKLFRFMKVYLLMVHLCVCANSALFRKSFPVPVNSRLFPTFSSIRFSLSGFMLRSLIH